MSDVPFDESLSGRTVAGGAGRATPCAASSSALRVASARRSAASDSGGCATGMMPLVTFSFPGYHEGTPAQRKLARSVWGQDIDGLPLNDVRRDGSRFPAFVLLSPMFETQQFRYVFTTMSAAGAVYEHCEDPPNSAGAETPMYSICPMRVVIEDKASGKRTQQDFPRYCHLFVDDPDQPAARNHTAVAFDAKTATAYFRVIQYGKPVPACDRGIRLK